MERLRKLYLDRFNQYGDSPEGVQWSDVQSQEKRFEILIEIADINNKKILDFGCGTGHLATYLKQQGINVQYTGVDIVDEFLTIGAKKHPECRFGKYEDFVNEKFDYIFISGVFNNKIEDNVTYYQKIIQNLFKMTNQGLAFNMMSYYVEYYDDALFYEKPENVFRFVKENVSSYLTIRNDYQVRPGVIPFEFCMYIYNKN